MAKRLDTDSECEDTIELELTAERMLALSRADSATRSNPLPVLSTEKSRSNAPQDQRGAWPAVILPIVVASLMSGAVAYLATIPAQSVQVGTNTAAGANTTAGTNTAPPAAPETSAPPSADAPVRFVNPFDATEVFQFPSGTSETQARQAVAELLLQRAGDRLKSLSEVRHQLRKTAVQVAPVTTTRLARRSDKRHAEVPFRAGLAYGTAASDVRDSGCLSHHALAQHERRCGAAANSDIERP
jgi:hypothetical protein